jgi:hypothetical protein
MPNRGWQNTAEGVEIRCGNHVASMKDFLEL